MIPRWLRNWYVDGHTGISSETIARTLTGEFCARPDAPYDPSDVGRCVALLDLAEKNGASWRARLPEVAAAVPAWAPLVPRWTEIENAYRAQVVAEEATRSAAEKRWPATWRRRIVYEPSLCWYLVSTLRGHGDPCRDRAVPWERS